MASKAGLNFGLMSHKSLFLRGVRFKALRLNKLTFFERLTSCSIYTSARLARIQKDYYTILGVSKTATNKEIREAYVQLAKRTHPDSFTKSDPLSPGEDFIGIQEAYEVLSDPTRKSEYDIKTFGYTRKKHAKDRYKVSVRQWDRPFGGTDGGERFRSESLDTNTHDKGTRDENSKSEVQTVIKLFYVGAAIVLVFMYFGFSSG